MIGTIPEIVAAIRITLAERVLPQLGPATWLAGDIRSSLALLTYLEDALAIGASAMGRANQAMIMFLEALLALREVSFLDPALRSRIGDVVSDAKAINPADLDRLNAGGEAMKELLGELIAASSSRGAGADDTLAITRLRACLVAVAAEEQRIAGRAGEMPPF